LSSLDVNPLLEHILSFSDDISDINLSVGKPPQVEINGALKPVPTRGIARLTPFQTEMIALQLLQGNREHLERLVKTGSCDLPYALPGRTRFRVNVFMQRGTYSAVLRVIPMAVPTLKDLCLPGELDKIADLRNGLVLVTGPTGSGKSTTLAAIVNEINHRHEYHVVTIEDPVEYLHRHVNSTINQREIGADAPTFALALRAALRQAPKVILVGEMRDLETVETALEASETGHLVLSTLHTIDAAKTIERIVGVFPKEEEAGVRMRFSQAFRYVISQRLARRSDVKGRIALVEILKSTMRTREYIQKGEGDGRSLRDAMHDGSMDGMQHFDQQIDQLVRAGVMSKRMGLGYATNPHNLSLELSDVPDIEVQRPEAQTREPAAVASGGGTSAAPPKDQRPDWMED
jgi:twitching motility protein PilT